VGCFTTIFVVVLFVFMMVTFIRWFEQTADAVDRRAWRELIMLVAMPFSVWLFGSRVSAGRPTPVPHHVPVRGFGSTGGSKPSAATESPAPAASPPSLPTPASDQPPPGTPREFLELPKPTVAKPRAGVDPDKIAKLKEKMRQQGMLPPE
jgi:hypothetical protein